jgi:hypothetical protein
MSSSDHQSSETMNTATTATPPSSRAAAASSSNTARSFRSNGKTNAVFVCGVLAMLAQLWSFRGLLLDPTLTTSTTANTKDCAEVYDLLRDAPWTTQQRNGMATTLTTTTNDENSKELPPPPPQAPAPPAPPPIFNQEQQQLSSNAVPLPRVITNSTNLSSSSSALVVIVLSRRDAFEVRTAIRTTWAANHTNVYFVLGQGCTIPMPYRGVDEGGNSYCKVQARPLLDTSEYMALTLQEMNKQNELTQRLVHEQEQYQDLLVMPHTIDMYRTLPAKLKFAYTFVARYLPSVEWVLKVDDDFFVRIDKFETLLQEQFDASKAILVGGDIRKQHNAHTGGKWKELPQFPRGALYPPFPLGSYGHAVTRPIVDYVATYQDALFDYQGEDVSLGIWLQQSSSESTTSTSTTSQAHRPPTTTFVSEGTHMSNGGDCRRPNLYVVGHDITPRKMQMCSRSDMWMGRKAAKTATNNDEEQGE